MTKVKVRSPLWIIGSFVSLAAILLGITVGVVLTSRKVPFWPKAGEGCMSVTLEPGYSWDNPDYSSTYTIKFKACNDFDSWFNTSAWFTGYDSDYIWSADGGWGLPNPINPGECKKGTLTINMDDSWTGSPVAQAKFIVAARDFCIGTGCTGCYHDEYITPTFGSGGTPRPTPTPKGCTSNAQCDDGNQCTNDVCSVDSHCRNTIISGTHKECENNACVSKPNTGIACTNTCSTNADCTTATPPAPTNLSVVTGKDCDLLTYSATLSWAGSAGANGYVVDVCNTSDPWSTCQYWTPHNVETQTTLELTGLGCNRDYYWRVWAYAGNDPSQNGTHGYPTNPFFTIDCCGEEPGLGTISGTVTVNANGNVYDLVKIWKCTLRDPTDPSQGGNCSVPGTLQTLYAGADRTDDAGFPYQYENLINGTTYTTWAAVFHDGTKIQESNHDTDCPTAPAGGTGRDCVVTVPATQNFTITLPAPGTIGVTVTLSEDSELIPDHISVHLLDLDPWGNSRKVSQWEDPALGESYSDSIPATDGKRYLIWALAWDADRNLIAHSRAEDCLDAPEQTPDLCRINTAPTTQNFLFEIPSSGEMAGLSVAGLGYTPPSVDVGDEVRFQFTYSNVGDAALPGSLDTPFLYVKAYVDDELVTEEGVYEGLEAGESKKYTTEGFWTATAGSHTARAVVESPLLEEPDTTDNEAVLAMTVPTPAGEGPAGQICNICGCTASGGDCGSQQCSQKCHQCLAKDRKWIADENRYEYAYTYTILGCLPVKPASFVIWFLRFAMGIGGGIAFLFMVMGVFKVLTGQGDVNKLIDGKKMISRAILGILVIVFAVIILRIIGLDILTLPGFSP